MNNAPQKPFTVSEITTRIRGVLEGAFTSIQVTGEITNVRQMPGSGHCYFTLKDETSQLSAVMFSFSAKSLSFQIENGLKVNATGKVTVYAQRGQYQLVVSQLELAGQGDLMARFEELKRKLAAEGLFVNDVKKPIPLLPLHIGIVTSPSGAAIRDILNVLSRRFPNLDILISPARVQGAEAANEIAKAIQNLNLVGKPNTDFLPNRTPPDVIIVTRGGGSLEDLWPFNEEVVARAIYNSEIPVISAVGHEIDFSISDFVADFRAPTPSAAAEIVIQPKDIFIAQVELLQDKLEKLADFKLQNARTKLDSAKNNRVFSEPSHAVEKYAQRVDSLFMQLENSLDSKLSSSKQKFSYLSAKIELEQNKKLPELQNRINKLSDSLSVSLSQNLALQKAKFVMLEKQISILNPTSVLDRGFSLTYLPNGKLLRNAKDAKKGTILETVIADNQRILSYTIDKNSGNNEVKDKKTDDYKTDQLSLF